jgi:hypothetical protein
MAECRRRGGFQRRIVTEHRRIRARRGDRSSVEDLLIVRARAAGALGDAGRVGLRAEGSQPISVVVGFERPSGIFHLPMPR